MHIGLLFTYGYSLNTWQESGTLSREILFYKKLAKENNVKFTFFTYGNESDVDIDLGTEDIQVVPIYKLINESENKFLNLFKSLYIPFKLKKYFVSIDLIKQNQLQGAWVAILLKLLTGLPLFTRTGYDVFKFSIHEKKSFLKIFTYYLLTQITLASSNFYTVSNKTELNYLNRKFLFSKNIALRPNWILDSEIVDIKERNENEVISVGRLEQQKNYEKLIKLFEGSEYEIKVIGSGSKKEELIKLAKEKRVNINFLGKVDNEELQNIYEKHLFFVTTSMFEGNPKSVLEAMSRGCIVIASDIENHNEIITDGENGYIIPNDCSSLDLYINSLLQDKKKLQAVSLNSREFVLNNYGIKSLCEFALNDYREICKN